MLMRLSWPVRRDADGQFALVEQGSDTERRELLGVLIGSRVGERAIVPAYGTQEMVGRFAAAVRDVDITDAARRWVPGVTDVDIAAEISGTDPGRVDLTVGV